MESLRIDSRLEIPETELAYRASRSSGPGGQNVNKVESRVTLLFDVAGSASLTDEQKERIRERLATRVNKQGVLRVTSQRHRTQAANREAARERFAELLRGALRTRRKRRRTRVGEAAKRQRVEDKRKRGQLKRDRRKPLPE